MLLVAKRLPLRCKIKEDKNKSNLLLPLTSYFINTKCEKVTLLLFRKFLHNQIENYLLIRR